jgi:hypothetical protein
MRWPTMGNEAKISRWSMDILEKIKKYQDEGIDYDSISLYSLQRWGFGDKILKRYLDLLESKGFIKNKDNKYFFLNK